jgi:hypothetical protein
MGGGEKGGRKYCKKRKEKWEVMANVGDILLQRERT